MSSRPARYRLKYGGFVVAAIGFVLTRVVVLESTRVDPSFVQFAVGAGLPLVAGLGIIVVGIGLAISTHERAYVNTIATWCILGTGGMSLVVSLAAIQTALSGGMSAVEGTARMSIATNALVGGAVAGILIGVRSAANRKHRRDLNRQVARNRVLNWILRHEVLNKVNVILGQTELLSATGGREHTDGGTELRTIRDGARHIEKTVDEVGFLVQTSEGEGSALGPVDLGDVLGRQIEAMGRAYPDATIDFEAVDGVQVRADHQLEVLFEHLLSNAIEHNDAEAPRVGVEVEPRPFSVRIHVTDDGPGLPPERRALLTDHALPEYDDPSAGFGLHIVRFLVDHYAGAVEVDSDDGTRVTVELPRPSDAGPIGSMGQSTYGVELSDLGPITLAALGAGTAMGLVLQTLTDTLPAIGGLYGVGTLAAGWILHLFHSVVFGVLFVAIVSRTPIRRYGISRARYALLGVGYGAALWLFAAGIVMPLWLRLVGISAPIPRLTLPSLVGHVIWGAMLGGAMGLRGRLTRWIPTLHGST